MKTRWLVDHGYRVKLFDSDYESDSEIASIIQADLQRDRPDLDPSAVTVTAVSTHPELIQNIAPVGLVVAAGYHDVMCALKLGKPTISLGHSQKFTSLMTEMGMAESHQPADALDIDRLIERFTELESRHANNRQQMAEQAAANRRSLDDQFALLSAVLFPALGPEQAAGRRQPVSGIRKTKT